MKGFVLFLVIVLLVYINTAYAAPNENHGSIKASGGGVVVGVVSGAKKNQSCGILELIVSKVISSVKC
ncbi:hypothetical protein B5X24_HaOG209424 [Helicoverpa armigera]|uniref:Uncharacterized protein n=1 Tax=Helicoverpa armigera TaxID=29058 RepID=A0A2W1BL14_HELAM|nr:hypothetical protein B5X24_HaOG209424 [Helicoverpa armigera]